MALRSSSSFEVGDVDTAWDAIQRALKLSPQEQSFIGWELRLVSKHLPKAQAEARLARAYPETNGGRSAGLAPLASAWNAPRRDGLLLLYGAALLLLLIACANVAGLMLARWMARTREIAIRTALGASPGQLASAFFAEASLLAVAGTTLGLFAADLAKSALLGLLIGGPVVLAALALMERAGPYWWLYAWLGWMALMLLMTWAWPAFIAPLFNKFSPLEDTELKARIESLLQRCGFTSEGVFVVDGSRRSAHGNAYFTGMGRNKRIVFFDTLLARLTHSEVEAVLAHELGHFKLKHVRKRLLLTVVTSLGALALLGWLTAQTPFYTAFGVQMIGRPWSDAQLLTLGMDYQDKTDWHMQRPPLAD